MDHTEALRLQAAEKYVLKELSPALMEEYEVHFFDCAQCAVDIKAATAFAQAARDAFRGDLKLASPSDSEPFFDRLFGWLRPAFTVPLLAGLLLFIGYQNAVTIPTAWRAAEIGATERFRASFLSRGSVPNGGSGDTIQIHEGQPFSLAFDFTPRSDKSYPRYVSMLKDASGRSVYQTKLPAELARRGISLNIPGGLVQKGKYQLIMYGQSVANASPGEEDNVGSVTFSVEFLQ